jgi:outer membrane protease
MTVFATLNNKAETMAEDVAARCGLKVKKVLLNDSTYRLETKGGYQIVKVSDAYYTHARKWPNGHITYLSPHLDWKDVV